MPRRTRLPFTLIAVLLLASLSCQAAGRAVARLSPASPTPTATATFTLTATATQTATSTVTLTPRPPTFTPTPTLTFTPLPPSATPTPLVTPDVVQMQVFERIWATVKREYLYTDFNGLDWEAIHSEYQTGIAAGMTWQAFYNAMGEMIRRLNDNHSRFMSPAQVQAEEQAYQEGIDFVGVGVMTTVILERSLVSILLVYPGSPAEAAGLKPHDNILLVNGQPILDEQGVRVGELRGPEGTQVTITVQSPGGWPRELTLTRRRINTPTPVPHQVLTSPAGKRIGYIYIPSFDDATIARQVGQALRDMTAGGALDGLIIDDRMNFGGTSTQILGTLAYFTRGTVGYFVNRQTQTAFTVQASDINGSQKIPLVVLVGKGTASFGEIFAGVLQDIGRAAVLGEATSGIVEILYGYNFPDGSRLWLAHDSFRPLKHPGVRWSVTGVVPDLTIASSWDQVTLETDPVIASAFAQLDE